MKVGARQRMVWMSYGLSVVTLVTGVLLAAHDYPGSFDWTHQVISALASRKHNPGGSVWFAGALGVGLVLLWPGSAAIGQSTMGRSRLGRVALLALRCGLVGGILVSAERLTFVHFSDSVRKGHETLALLTFLLLYAGILGLELAHLRQRDAGRWMTLVVIAPLIAIGASEFVLYLGQRGVGWLDHDWRQADLPVWARFAFWQWLALASLWLAAGHLLFLANLATRRPAAESPADLDPNPRVDK